MTEKELIRQIQKLRNIQPDQEWLDLTRQNLIKQTKQQIGAAPKNLELLQFFYWLMGYFRLAAIMAGILVILIGGPWLIVKASQPSLPGEMLYSIKKATEGIQVRVASEDAKAQLQVEFASRRLEELNKLTEDSLSPEEKTEKVEQVVSDFQNNLAGASLHVSKITKENALAMAKQAKKLRENLAKTKGEVPLAVQEKLTQAEKAVEEINHQILAVLVKAEQEETEETEETDEAATTTDEEILIFLEEADLETMTTTDEVIEE